RHSHPGGREAHGYFEHDEDRRPRRRGGPEHAQLRMPYRAATQLMRDWHNGWMSGETHGDASAAWANCPEFTFARMGGTGHTLYVGPDLSQPATTSDHKWAVLDLPDVAEHEPANGAVLLLGFAAYEGALLRAAYTVAGEERTLRAAKAAG